MPSHFVVPRRAVAAISGQGVPPESVQSQILIVFLLLLQLLLLLER